MSEWPEDLVTALEAALTARKIPFRAIEDGGYELDLGEAVGTIWLGNIARRVQRDGDIGAVDRFLDSVLAGPASLPSWEQAQQGVFTMIESAEMEFGSDTLVRPVSEGARIHPVYFDEEAGTIRFIQHADMEEWGIAEDALWETADANLDLIMQRTEVDFLDADGLTLGVIKAHEPHKASLVRAPSLRQKVEARIGWPIYAVAPSRGFVYLVNQEDHDEVGLLGGVVINEFLEAEYPISTEVWEINDKGIEALGAFNDED